MSLDFYRVAHETAAAINDVTQSHIHELADLHSIVASEETPEHYITTSLENLAFTMSDRANNEKKADKLLDEWRDQVLEQCTENPHNLKSTISIVWHMFYLVSIITFVQI